MFEKPSKYEQILLSLNHLVFGWFSKNALKVAFKGRRLVDTESLQASKVVGVRTMTKCEH